MDSRAVGVFDSGMGGLTVLHECLVTMPHEDFVYLGDGARLPYGPRPLPEVSRFAHEIGAYLEGLGVKLILVACNSATAAALPGLQESLSVPVVGVITPEAHAAVQATRSRRIGLLATKATVASGRYEALVHALDAGVRMTSIACPELVPLIESDDPFGPETTAAVRGYAQPLKDAGVDTVILGLHALPADQADLPARVRPRRHARLLGRGDRARGRPDARPQGDRERPGEGGDVPLHDHRRHRDLPITGARFLQLPIDAVEHVRLADLERAAA